VQPVGLFPEEPTMNQNETHDPTYKVWLEIEEFDLATEDGYTLPGTPGGPIAEFTSHGHAKLFVEAVERLRDMLNLRHRPPAPP
jgi:hypothetical protein